MKISVVIPTVDRTDPLRRAVSNCISQLDPSDSAEIVVVDNSPDGRQRWVIDEILAKPANSHPLPVRLIHEPRRGLAHARNSGIAEARGEFVVFLDDDEEPQQGWLRAIVEALEQTGADAAFGAVIPVFAAPPRRLADVAIRLYTRLLSVNNLQDISPHFNLLGTGNSCFRAATCFAGEDEPFDPRFNQTGGEDTDFLRRLYLKGRTLVWAADAVVQEFVPADRLTPAYMGARRFMQGQMRSFSHMASIPKRPDKTAFWMLAGAAQYAGHALAAALNAIAGRDEQADAHRIQAQGGLGKVLWQARFRRVRYGAPEAGA